VYGSVHAVALEHAHAAQPATFFIRILSLLQGRSREEAFRVGVEIAAAVTAANPPPVTLKFEKVGQPAGACVSLRSRKGGDQASSQQRTTTRFFKAAGVEAAFIMPACVCVLLAGLLLQRSAIV
jgi:hypothetical protein